MTIKKNYHGMLKVLLSLLFTMLFACCSTSYASISDPFSADELNQINDFFNINITQTTLNIAYNYLKGNFPNISKLNIVFVLGSNSLNGTNYLYLICNNGTYSSELDYLKVTSWSNTYFKINSVENINDTTNHIYYYTRIDVNTSYITGLESTSDLRIWTGENPPFTLNSSFFTSNRLLTTRNMATFYAYTINDTIRVVLSTNYIILDDYVQPEEPSGDVPSSSLGDIIDISGDNRGNINLQPIENSLNNIQNQISGDTQRIIDNQNVIAQQQHEDLTSYDENIADNDVTDLIENIQDTLSGDLSNSEIFGALEQAESGFLDLITGQATDFIISWNDIRLDSVHNNDNKVLNHASGFNFSSLNGAITLNTSSTGVIIPSGFINFSKACRENSTLGSLKEKLNIILSALCGLALIKYLYNLLLATLGIDNPYLYDKNTDNDYIKTVDKNTGTTTFSGVNKDGTRWKYSYNSKGGKNK